MARIDITLRFNGSPVSDDMCQPIHITLQANGRDPVERHSELPFSTRCLRAVTRLLEVSKSNLQFEFLVEEIDDLKTHGLAPNSIQCHQGQDRVRLDSQAIGEILNLYKHEIIAEKLYVALFPNIDPCTLLENPSDSSVLHLRFYLPADNTPEPAQRILDMYPWELLGSSRLKAHFKRSVSVSRYIQQVQRPQKLPTIDCLNILFVRTRPSGFEEDLSNDLEEIKKAIENNNHIRAHDLEEGTFRALKEYLDDSKNPKPQILHFDGHGVFGRYCTHCQEPAQVKTDKCPKCGNDLEACEGFLAFEGLSDKAHWVKASLFETIVCDHGVQLVFLNACRSARNIPTAFAGVAQQLARTVPAVIATPFHLEAPMASEFARSFYRKLTQTGSLIDSMESARKSLIASPIWMHGWYRFALYLRYCDNDDYGKLFNPNPVTIFPSNDIETEVRHYKIGLISRLESDAAHLKDVLRIEDHIRSYIQLEAVPVWDSTLHEKGKQQRLLDLLYSFRQRRVLLFGEAGAGKTTSLRRYAWELAQNHANAIPILASLQRCATESITTIVLAELNKDGGFPKLRDEQELKRFLQSRNDIFLLFDGLNEIPSNAKDAWVDINTFLNSFSAPSVVITCRMQNVDLAARLGNNIERYLILQSLSDKQIEYYLPCSDDQELSNPARIRGLARNPFLLTLLRNVQETHRVQFHRQHEVFTRFVNITLAKDRQSKIGQGIKDETKLNALAYLAFYLNEEHRVSIDRNDGIEILSKGLNLEKGSADAIVESAITHGFVVEEQTASGKSRLSFAPNLMMQEYFAAWKLRELVMKEFERPITFKEIFTRLLSRDRLADVSTLALDCLNPSPGILKRLIRDPWWGETFVLLAGLLQDYDKYQNDGAVEDWFIGRLAIAWDARWLTKWSLEQGLPVRDGRIIDIVEKWGYSLDSPDRNKRYEAVKDLLALTPRKSPFPLPRTIPLLIKAAGDVDYQVAQAACQGLVSFKEYETELEATAREMTRYYPKGTRRVLLALKDEIDETFPLKMIPIKFMRTNQPGYWISQFPVTNAEYREFIVQSNYPVCPENWGKDEFQEIEHNHSVTFVSWNDVCAYCDWLSRISGYYVRLPTEDEWEQIITVEDASLHSQVDKQTVGCRDIAYDVCEWCLPMKKRGTSLCDSLMPLRKPICTNTGEHILHTYEFKRIDRRRREAYIGFRVVVSTAALVKYLASSSSDDVIKVQSC